MDTAFQLGNLMTNLPEKVDLSPGIARQPLRGGRKTQAVRGFCARFGPSCVAPRGSAIYCQHLRKGLPGHRLWSGVLALADSRPMPPT